MYTSIIPIFAAFLTAFVLYRPFITRLDRVKYYVFSTIAFFTPWILSVSSLADEKYYTANNTVTADYRLHWSSHYRPVQSTMNHQQQQSYSQSYLFIDATVLALGAAMAVSILGLLTRWHFAILFVNPRANSFTSILIRHGISMALVLFGIVSQTTTAWHTLAPIMGGLWYLSGSYLLRRCQSLVTTSLMVAIMGTLSSQRSPIESQMLSTWTFLDWTAYGFLVAMACSVLDHLDALMNTYPHLVTCDTKWITKMQNPLTHEYWFAMIQLVANLPAETDLNAGPIDDLKTAIRLLGPASRSWKTMAALFPVNLRQDLCLIYAFFRIADDLVDDAPTPEECRENLAIIRRFLREAFSNNDKVQQQPSNNIANDATLPNHINWTLYAELLPSEDVLSVFRSFARVAHYLCPRAMFELTDAWEMDLNGAPIRSQEELLRYAALISGTFGELCTCVIMYKTGRGNWNGADTVARDNTVLARARATGQCLQLINIARDVIADSLVGRCYVPLQYMSNPSTEYSMLKHSREPQQIGDHILKTYALRILDLSDQITDQAQRGINGLPEEVQDAIRAAFEIYMAIAPTLRNHSGFPLRTKVPKPKQQWIALRCIYGFHGPVARAIHSMGCRFLSAPRGLSAFIKLAPLPKKKL